MADISKTGAANAAAVWCTRNLLNGEKCSPQQRAKFKCSLASAIHQELNRCSDSNIACVVQIRNEKPNEILEGAMKIARVTNDMLTISNVLVTVFPTVVWVDKEFTNSGSKVLPYECIYKIVEWTKVYFANKEAIPVEMDREIEEFFGGNK